VRGELVAGRFTDRLRVTDDPYLFRHSNLCNSRDPPKISGPANLSAVWAAHGNVTVPSTVSWRLYIEGILGTQ
jgi:hypothetical protein